MAEEENQNGNEEDIKEEPVADIAPFDPTKKKKKKKVGSSQEPLEDSVDNVTERIENLSVSEGGLDSAFADLKKKKKKKPVRSEVFNEETENHADELDSGDLSDEDEAAGEIVLGQQTYPWEGSDRNYIYEELLGRVFNILRENNPELAGERRRTVMRPPQVLREGTKKTVFANFMDICKTSYDLLDAVNSTGKAFLSHTVLSNMYVLRCAVGAPMTKERHVVEAWKILQDEATTLLNLNQCT